LIRLACVFIIFFANVAAAQPAGDLEQRQAAARGLFEEGLVHLQAERWEQAVDRFERAYAVRSSPEIAYNLSSALIRTGRLVRASELLRGVAASPQASVAVRDAASGRLQQVLPRLARLTVNVAGARRDVSVWLDDNYLEAAMLGVALPVDPGHHTVVAGLNLPNVPKPKMIYDRTIEISEGGAITLTVDPGTGPRTPPSLPLAGPPVTDAIARREGAPAATAGAGLFGRWWFWTALGVVAAGTAAAVVLASREGDVRVIPGNAGTVYLGGE